MHIRETSQIKNLFIFIIGNFITKLYINYIFSQCIKSKSNTENTIIKKFIITDCGMNDLMRPALYDSYHKILPLSKTIDSEIISTDIVGPICESTDKLFSSEEFYDVKEGEFLAIRNSGAYGSSMSSNYNARPLVREIVINEDNFTTSRKRQSVEDSIAQEIK